MIKSDLIKTISKQYNLSTRQATAILQTCLDEIVSSLIKGDTVELRRFGVFKTKLQKARTIKHPVTGKPIKRPAKKVILFEASLTVKKNINKKCRLLNKTFH